MLIVGDDTEDLVGGDRDTVEVQAPGAREPLAEAVVLGIGRHPRVGRIDAYDQRLTALGAYRAEHQPVGDLDARGERLAPVEDVPAAGRGERQVGARRRLQVRDIGTAAPEPLLRHRPEFEPVGPFRGAEETGTPRQHIVPGEQFTDGAVGRRDLPDDRAGGTPVGAAPGRSGRCQQTGQTRFAQPCGLVERRLAGTVAAERVDGEVIGDLPGDAEPDPFLARGWGSAKAGRAADFFGTAPFTVPSCASGAVGETGPPAGESVRTGVRTPISPTPDSLVFPLD